MSGAEVIAVFGAISSILQVIDFTSKVVSNAHDTVVAAKDATQSNADAKSLAQQYEYLGEKLHALPVNAAGATAGERAVHELAKKCHDDAQTLLRQLERLSVSPNKTGFRRLADGLTKAVKATTQRGDIEMQRQSLHERNGQLATAILHTLLEKQQDLPKTVQQVIDAVEKSTEDAVTKALSLLDGEESIRRRTEEILDRLSFPEINSRWKSIGKAYDSTCCWALDRDKLEFRSWLQKGGGTFWITGKAGSGKSTLMKFLSEHQTTRNLLEEWSGNKQLIFASHYFWYAGSPLQKSIEGLLRTILYHVLKEASALVQVAFEEWYPNSTAMASLSLRDFSYAELMTAFNRLVGHGSSQLDKRFCLFIDGLDEYKGNHGELVTTLNNLLQNTDIKLCVSSRPWNAFSNAYGTKVPSLRLEDLTRKDIWKYVNGKITSATATYGQASVTSSTDTDTASLVKDITDRAEGVFLWVYLVVNSVLNGLAEGDSIMFLRHRVKAFPKDLDAYFASVLERTDSIYKMQTHQMLYYAWLLADPKSNMARSFSNQGFLAYWLMGKDPQGLSSADFAFDMDIDIDAISPEPSARADMVAQTRRFLSASCKDLLQLRDGEVDFLHRSVLDFLSQDEMQSRLSAVVPKFFLSQDGITLLCSMQLACGKLDWHSISGHVERFLGAVEDVLNPKISCHLSPEDGPKFARECEALLLRSLEERGVHSLGFIEEAPILVPLIVFQHYEFANKYLIEWPNRQGPRTNKRTRHSQSRGKVKPEERELLSQCLHASLGGYSFGTLSIDDVNVAFIAALLGRAKAVTQDRADELEYLRADYLETNHNTEVDCCEFAWQILLRQWALRSQRGQLRNLRNIWEAAKLFLPNPRIQLDPFCIQPGSCFKQRDKHQHVWMTPKQFLVDNLPREWLLESPYTRRLAGEKGNKLREQPGATVEFEPYFSDSASDSSSSS